jgi:CHAT domain-containing protein/Flp pilus assembly protein TadD
VKLNLFASGLLFSLSLGFRAVAATDFPESSIEQLIKAGTTALNENRYEKSEATWREILRRDPKNYDAYIKLGDTLKSAHLGGLIEDYRKSIQEATLAYQSAISLNPKRTEGYLKLAELERQEGDNNAAIKTYHQAIARAEPSAEVYYMLGIRILDNPYNDRIFSAAERKAAFDAFLKGSQIKAQDTTYTAYCYVVLGDEYLQGQDQIDAYQAAINLNHFSGYRSYGNLLERQNRSGEAVLFYQKAIQQNLKGPHVIGLYGLLGKSLVKLDRLSEAEAAYREIVQLSPDSLYDYFTLGDVLKKQGKLDEALRIYESAAEVVRPESLSNDGVYSYYQVSEHLIDRGLFDLAIKTYRKAFLNVDPKEHYRLYGLMGRTLQMQGKSDEALVALRQSILLNPARNYGKVLQEKGKLEDAKKELLTAIGSYQALWTGVSDKNKILLAEIQAVTYQLLQKVLVLQNRPNEALEISEQGRSRALVELLTQRFSKTIANDLEQDTKSLNLDQIRAIAKNQNATLVEYAIIDQKLLYVWVIKPNGEIKFKTTDLNETVPIAQIIADSRAALRRSIQNKNISPTQESPDFNQSLAQLHKTLIVPIAADLPADPNQHIIFIPQGELFLVPFPALQDAQGKYLIEKHTISTAPSIQTLQLTHEKAKRARSGGSSVVVGNPTMPIFQGQQLPDLPGAKDEAISIGKLLNTRPLLGDQATKTTVINQMQTASIIHLATHGLLNNVQGDIPGAIALAPSGTDSGFLTASDLFGLNLTANLAVLSACDTGRGDITNDGVVGLSRSLIAAGIPSVIVSLWAVNDESTNTLMSQFYRNLQTNPNKAQALRQSMLTTLKQYPNPTDWGAFTLIGER